MEIAIARHGPPDAPPKQRLSAREFAHWVRQYNTSLLHHDARPPPSLLAYAEQCPLLLCSKLARSLDSARALGVARPLIFDAIFDEAGMPSANWSAPKMSPRLWLVFFRLSWLLGYRKHSESVAEARRRAVTAAARLETLAREQGRILLLGHGFFNRMIVRELIKAGWAGPVRPSRHFWGLSVYRKVKSVSGDG